MADIDSNRDKIFTWMTNMKMKLSLILATAVTANLFAQQVTNPPPLPLDAPMLLPMATNTPVARPAKKKAAKPAVKKSAVKPAAKPAAKEIGRAHV